METTFFGASFWGIAKVLVLICVLLYIVFAVVILRQVRLMTETLEVGFEEPVKLIALVHLIAAIGLFFFALVIL